MDKRKAIVLSINLCSAEFVQSDTEGSQELQVRLKEMNDRWDRLGSSLGDWRSSLQDALMQCHVGVLCLTLLSIQFGFLRLADSFILGNVEDRIPPV